MVYGLYTLHDCYIMNNKKLPMTVTWLRDDNKWVQLEFVKRYERYETVSFDVHPLYSADAINVNHEGFANQKRYRLASSSFTKHKKCDWRNVILVTGCRCGRGCSIDQIFTNYIPYRINCFTIVPKRFNMTYEELVEAAKGAPTENIWRPYEDILIVSA